MKKSTRALSSPEPPRSGKRAENKEKTRRAILEAALGLFAQKGFYQTTTKAISRKARIAEGTLFNYFETKEDLALYLCWTDSLFEWALSEDSRVAKLMEAAGEGQARETAHVKKE